jgi:AcrR family transcriptional regulator
MDVPESLLTKELDVASQTAVTGSPRGRFREMMRADILNAGLEILREGGFTALSMRALAEAVGVRAPTLYDYFANKEEVLNELFLEGIKEIRQHFQPAMATSQPGVARIIGLGLAYRDFAIANPVLFQLVFGRIDSSYVPGEEQMQAGHDLYMLLRGEVEQAVEIGEFEAADIDILSMTIWSAIHGITTLELAGFSAKCAPDAPIENLSPHVVSSLLYGILPRRTDDSPAVSCPVPIGHPLRDRA